MVHVLNNVDQEPYVRVLVTSASKSSHCFTQTVYQQHFCEQIFIA